jgi:ATP phosphoribosyltransferase
MNRLKIAIQKSGRLSERSIQLLKDAGIKLANGTSSLKAQAENFPLDILYLRDDDIPQYVEQQVADIGIIGENVFLEKGKEIQIIEKLGFAKCRMSLAIPKTASYRGLASLEGSRIATSYPVILKRFLAENGIKAEIEEISGSVEIAPSIGLADAVFDIVSTGSTLLTNGLQEVETVMNSEAVMVSRVPLSAEKQEILDRLLFRMKAVKRSSENKYILMNAPDSAVEAISSLLPGMRSPTVVPLAQEGWSSIHSVVKEDEFWEVIEGLKARGAEGILVIPIEKMIL